MFIIIIRKKSKCSENQLMANKNGTILAILPYQLFYSGKVLKEGAGRIFIQKFFSNSKKLGRR